MRTITHRIRWFQIFITFIDDSCRFIAIYFLKLKSDALKCFHEFRIAAEKFLGYPVIFLRIDNAPELIYGQFEAYCKEHGITYDEIRPVVLKFGWSPPL